MVVDVEGEEVEPNPEEHEGDAEENVGLCGSGSSGSGELEGETVEDADDGFWVDDSFEVRGGEEVEVVELVENLGRW